MPIEITIPRLGWSMEEGNFVNWLKEDGETVKSGEPLFSLENEKAVQEVEAVDDGILHIPRDGPKPGGVVKVGQVIGHLLGENESCEIKATATSPAQAEAAPESKPELHSEVAGKSSISPNDGDCQTGNQPPISPRARRLAAQLGVDAARLRGSGPDGRITEKDVRDAAG